MDSAYKSASAFAAPRFDAPLEGEAPGTLLTRLLMTPPDDYNLQQVIAHHAQTEAMLIDLQARILQQLVFLKTSSPTSIEAAQVTAASYFKLVSIKDKLTAGMDTYHRVKAAAFSQLDKKVTIEMLHIAGGDLSKLALSLNSSLYAE